jgi:hypothetical protein
VSYDEGFPQVCYTYGQDGYNSILCPFKIPEKSASKDDDNVNSDHDCSGNLIQIELSLFDSVVAVAFQIIFRAKMHANNFFYFLKIIFDINTSK